MLVDSLFESLLLALASALAGALAAFAGVPAAFAVALAAVAGGVEEDVALGLGEVPATEASLALVLTAGSAVVGTVEELATAAVEEGAGVTVGGVLGPDSGASMICAPAVTDGIPPCVTDGWISTGVPVSSAPVSLAAGGFWATTSKEGPAAPGLRTSVAEMESSGGFRFGGPLEAAI